MPGLEARLGVNVFAGEDARFGVDAKPAFEIARGGAEGRGGAGRGARGVGGSDGVAEQPDQLQVERRDDQAGGDFESHARL